MRLWRPLGYFFQKPNKLERICLLSVDYQLVSTVILKSKACYKQPHRPTPQTKFKRQTGGEGKIFARLTCQVNHFSWLEEVLLSAITVMTEPCYGMRVRRTLSMGWGNRCWCCYWGLHDGRSSGGQAHPNMHLTLLSPEVCLLAILTGNSC